MTDIKQNQWNVIKRKLPFDEGILIENKIQQMFNQLDVDKSGKLDKDEIQ